MYHSKASSEAGKRSHFWWFNNEKIYPKRLEWSVSPTIGGAEPVEGYFGSFRVSGFVQKNLKETGQVHRRPWHRHVRGLGECEHWEIAYYYLYYQTVHSCLYWRTYHYSTLELKCLVYEYAYMHAHTHTRHAAHHHTHRRYSVTDMHSLDSLSTHVSAYRV